jgi:hypothetical protein
MLAEYVPILVFIVIALVFGAVALIVGFVLGPRHAYAEKDSPYECGFEAFEDARMQFDVRYYLVLSALTPSGDESFRCASLPGQRITVAVTGAGHGCYRVAPSRFTRRPVDRIVMRDVCSVSANRPYKASFTALDVGNALAIGGSSRATAVPLTTSA